MKNFFPTNIKLLRKRLHRTQEDVALALNMKRSTLSGYENEIAEPGVGALIAISGYYRIPVDTLLKVDLTKLRESELYQLERGTDIFYSGGNLRVLSTTVDRNNDENIEIVNEKALAGYRTGFADPEYLKVLPAFQLPFLSKQKKYRTFQISGDSMLPIAAGSWVTAEFVQNWFSIRNGQACIILTIADGLVFKIVENLLEKHGVVRAHSLNTLFEPYDIAGKDIREIWRFVHYISPDLPEPNVMRAELETTVARLQKDMEMVKQKLAIQQQFKFTE